MILVVGFDPGLDLGRAEKTTIRDGAQRRMGWACVRACVLRAVTRLRLRAWCGGVLAACAECCDRASPHVCFWQICEARLADKEKTPCKHPAKDEWRGLHLCQKHINKAERLDRMPQKVDLGPCVCKFTKGGDCDRGAWEMVRGKACCKMHANTEKAAHSKAMAEITK